MFDEDDYYSDEDDNVMQSTKNMGNSKVLLISSKSDFNHLTGEGETLLKLMKDRGFDLNENEVKKIKANNKTNSEIVKNKPKTGFFDGGASATLEELIKALKKAFSNADPHQVSCILSYILEKKNLSIEDRSKFSLKKCDILFGLGAYKECVAKSEEFLDQANDSFTSASLCNFMAKCKAELGEILSGYTDYLRAHSYLQAHKIEIENEPKQSEKTNSSDLKDEVFADTEINILNREIDHTELEYNIKMTKYKNQSNLVHPYYPQFRHKQVIQVVCGDYHTLILMGGSLIDDSVKIKWRTEVFGMGENSAGQIMGYPTHEIMKEPVLISGLSGKNIEGIWASRESSLAYDAEGNIYEWGIKENKDNHHIEKIQSLHQPIKELRKGYEHYTLITESGKFYTWGRIVKNSITIYESLQPELQQCSNITSFCCLNCSVVAVDGDGQCFGLGSNEFGQLAMPGEEYSRKFKKIKHPIIHSIRKVVGLGDCIFYINSDEEVFLCGKYSYDKEPIHSPKQAEFSNDLTYIISISGSIGNYYVTNSIGELYHWDVPTSMKFRLNKDEQIAPVRYISANRGNLYRVRTLIEPPLCTMNKITETAQSFCSINFQLHLHDSYGPFGNSNFVLPLRCQIFLSTYEITKEELTKENDLFIESNHFAAEGNQILLNEIIECRLTQYKITADEDEPWVYNLCITADGSGKYFFYVLLEKHLLYAQELIIELSEKERENKEKNEQDKIIQDEERHLKAEAQRKKLREDKTRKEAEEEQKTKETQKRAEDALKKYMREQEETKLKVDEERKAKKELQTGGGFDLNKFKAKNSIIKAQSRDKVVEKIEKHESEISSEMGKSSESFLPDIRQRPSSKKKLNLLKQSEVTVPSKCKMTTTNFKSMMEGQPEMYKTKTTDIDSKNTTTAVRSIIRRGLSKNKKS